MEGGEGVGWGGVDRWSEGSYILTSVSILARAHRWVKGHARMSRDRLIKGG